MPSMGRFHIAFRATLDVSVDITLYLSCMHTAAPFAQNPNWLLQPCGPQIAVLPPAKTKPYMGGNRKGKGASAAASTSPADLEAEYRQRIADALPSAARLRAYPKLMGHWSVPTVAHTQLGPSGGIIATLERMMFQLYWPMLAARWPHVPSSQHNLRQSCCWLATRASSCGSKSKFQMGRVRRLSRSFATSHNLALVSVSPESRQERSSTCRRSPSAWSQNTSGSAV
eukprot:22336-Amphidinium_carterae.3